MKRIVITQRPDLDKSITIPLTINNSEFGREELIEKYVASEVKKQSKTINEKEKLVFKCNDFRQIKFFFFKNNVMLPNFDNNNLSKSEKDFYYNSQFIIEVFDTNIPTTQKRLDIFYITLYKTNNFNQSEFNLNSFLSFIAVSELYIKNNIYVRFSFYNAKDSKKYVFKHNNTTEINNSNQFIKLLLDATTKKYTIDVPNLDFYQAVTLTKKGIPETNAANDLAPKDEDSSIIETKPNNNGSLLDSTGLLLREQTNIFTCYPEIAEDVTAPTDRIVVPNVFKDFYNPRYPVITVKLVDYTRDSLFIIPSGYSTGFTNSCSVPIRLGRNPNSGVTVPIPVLGNATRDDGATQYFFVQFEVQYHSNYTVNFYDPIIDENNNITQIRSSITYPMPYPIENPQPIVLPNVKDFNFTGNVNGMSLQPVKSTYGSTGVGGVIRFGKSLENGMFPYDGEITPLIGKFGVVQALWAEFPLPGGKYSGGTVDFEFNVDSNDINVIFLDKNNKIINEGSSGVLSNPSRFVNKNEYGVDADGNLGLINRGDEIYNPATILRMKKTV